MEILVFGLLAMRNGYRQPEEPIVPEPDELQPFDVRTLAHLYNVKNVYSRPPIDATSSLRAQAAS